MAIVAANKNFDVYLTSTPPNQLRFRILDVDSSFKIRLSMYYFTSNRIDLYKNNIFTDPTNAYYSNGNMILKDPSSDLKSYMPTYQNSSGTNLFVKANRKIYFAMGGSDFIDLKIASVLVIKFGVPAITEDAFFNSDTLVQNFADLLGVDPSKIRRVEIVRETRRKRISNSIVQILLTLFNNAPSNLTDANKSNTTTLDLTRLEAEVTNRFVTGQLEKDALAKFNVSLVSLILQKASDSSETEIPKLSKLFIDQEPDGCDAQISCRIQPILHVLDEHVNKLFYCS
jgi:hypothetical protein